MNIFLFANRLKNAQKNSIKAITNSNKEMCATANEFNLQQQWQRKDLLH